MPGFSRRATASAAVTAAGALALLVVLAGATARAHRPPAFGDELRSVAGVPTLSVAVRAERHALDAYDARTGAPAWSYRRHGRTLAEAVRTDPDLLVAVWSDGMLTAVDAHRPRVRWHRFVPGLADWLRWRPSGAPVVVPEGPILLVLTPGLIVDFRTGDGNLRWDTASGPGCAYLPQYALQADGAVVLPRRCAPGIGTSSTVEAFDPAGRRWQVSTGPEARPRPFTPAPGRPLDIPPRPAATADAAVLPDPPPGYLPGPRSLIEVADPPHLRPQVLDADTGRYLLSCTPRPRPLAPGCADPEVPEYASPPRPRGPGR